MSEQNERATGPADDPSAAPMVGAFWRDHAADLSDPEYLEAWEQAEREARYAEALFRGDCEADGVEPEARDWLWGEPEARQIYATKARSVMAVADAEQAELRDEVEGCHRALTALDRLLGEARSRAESAEARVRELEAAVQELRDAHQAEVEKVGRVEALADRWMAEDHKRAVLTIDGVSRRLRELRIAVGLCHHCGKGDDPDGDHSCSCPYSDEECPHHRIEGAWRAALSEPATAPGGDHV